MAPTGTEEGEIHHLKAALPLSYTGNLRNNQLPNENNTGGPALGKMHYFAEMGAATSLLLSDRNEM